MKKCSYSEFFWSVFSHIRTEYGERQSISPYSAQMREKADQKNSECGHFSRIEMFDKALNMLPKSTNTITTTAAN